MTTAEFAANWAIGPNSFADNPPNAELVGLDDPKDPATATLELRELEWDADDPDQLRYAVAHVGDGAALEAGRCGPATLFIDDRQ